ncbi:hypothetical protein HXX76_013374 [Chlamydomonas incerta]|uniref:Tyrosine specific protein phosphatases domain-containing protein n=1 Tax=Chlamydomonas incerta TaxID=51695 RepID=A0A835SM46_CHLIN|nr:hypothetical protein HXX76_013374 [Chlamydomonas incerta]|eukprot:KAG2426003.1 hypothetical protein HXX76_013374 [Chlamydomonas incerta]
MSCKADAKYNFGRASAHDDIVFGAARPGAASQRCFNPDDKVTVPEVEEWAAFMSGHGVTRVVSLLSQSEVGTYVQPPTDTLATLFKRAVLVDAKAPGAADQLVAELKAAVDAGEKVVVHCWGGGGRTGMALAAWLVRQHGLTPEAAAEQVESYAKGQGASRRADVAQLRAFLGTSA